MSIINQDLDVFSAWEEGSSYVFKQLEEQCATWANELKHELDSGLSNDEFSKKQGLYEAVSMAQQLCFNHQ
ncbi:MAG: hypothetical protein K6F05_00780 [Succinivibrio sp.]|nr:hypothetical protein [Succinivibrio sp.]